MKDEGRTFGRAARALPGAMLIASVAAAFTLISVENEIEIGRQGQAEIEKQVPRIADEQVAGYVDALGQRLAGHAPGPEYPYSFSVADYREINAFALPGGPVWVHRGILQAAENESQIAGVVAHEIAHIAERHAAEQITRALVAQGALGLLGAIIGADGAGARAAEIGARLFATGYLLRFSREHEFEADRVGAQMMHRAGWDPRGAAEFMEIIRREQGRDPARVEVFLSTHPAPAERVDRLRASAAELGPGQRDSAQFQDIKRRLERLPPAQEMPRR